MRTGRPLLHITEEERAESIKIIQLRAYLKKHNKTMEEYLEWKKEKERNREILEIKKKIKLAYKNFDNNRLKELHRALCY